MPTAKQVVFVLFCFVFEKRIEFIRVRHVIRTIGQLKGELNPFKGYLQIFIALRSEWSELTQLCLTLFDPMDCNLLDCFVHGIFQARILEWVAISFSRRSSWPRDWIWVSLTVGRHCTNWATREVLKTRTNSTGRVVLGWLGCYSVGNQCKAIEENNRMGKTRDLFKKIPREYFMQRWAQ